MPAFPTLALGLSVLGLLTDHPLYQQSRDGEAVLPGFTLSLESLR